MAHRVKCPECKTCMAPIWIMPNRYYFCELCRVYYSGTDNELIIVPSNVIYDLMKGSNKNDIPNRSTT